MKSLLALFGAVTLSCLAADESIWGGGDWIACDRKLDDVKLIPAQNLGPWVSSGDEEVSEFVGRVEVQDKAIVRALAWWQASTRAQSTLVLNGDDEFFDRLVRNPRRYMDLAFDLKAGENEIALRFLEPQQKVAMTFGLRIQYGDGSEQWFKSGPESWQAKTVGGESLALTVSEENFPAAVEFPRERLAPAWFRKTFEVKDGLKSATLAHVGVGYGDSFLNGMVVSDRVLSPPQTDYENVTMFNQDDVTAMLKEGKNVYAMQVASGWFNQVGGFGAVMTYGRPRMKMALKLDYEDGGTEWITSGPGWHWKEGAWREANIYAGEWVDFRLAHTEWASGEGKWKDAQVFGAPGSSVVPRDFAPMRRIREIAPVEITQVASQTWLVDFGENIAGWAKLSFEEEAGQEILLRYTEMARDGKLWNVPESHWWCHGEPQRDILIADGKKRTYESRFTYKGFRYLEVSGLREAPTAETLQAVVVNTDSPERATFQSSNPLLERFWKMALRTHHANMHSILEDCPHREKCQWGGDLHGSWAVGFHGLEADDFYRQQVRLFYTGPLAQGGIPGLIGVGKRLTTIQMDFNWGVSPLFLTYRLWTHGGDLEFAREVHPSMKHYLAWFDQQDPDGFPHLHKHADHAPATDVPRKEQDKELISAINYFAAAERFAEMSEQLGLTEDGKWGRQLAEKIREAVLTRFDGEKSTFGNGTQDSLALAMGVFRGDKEQEKKLATSLAGYYRENGFKFDGGFMSYWIYPMLSRYGYVEEAYRMLVNTDYPGPAWSVEKWDATTFWERYLYDERDQFERSLSHHATNHPAAWLLTDLAGIRIDVSQPGGRHLILGPSVPKDLTSASGTMKTVAGGEVASEWEQENGKLSWKVSVPDGVEAKVVLPAWTRANGQKIPALLEAGAYSFELVRK